MSQSDLESIRDYIEKHPLAVLSTIDENETSWGAAVYVIASIEKSPALYILSKSSAQKYKNMLKRPSVALTFVDEGEQSTLQISGVAKEVKKSEERQPIIDLFLNMTSNRINGWAPLVKIESGTVIVMKISPSYIQLSDFKGHTPNKINLNL